MRDVTINTEDQSLFWDVSIYIEDHKLIRTQGRILGEGALEASATRVTRGAQKKKERKKRERKRERKRGKKGKKKRENDKSTWRIGRHSSTSTGPPEGLQGRKLQGSQYAILQLYSRAPKFMTHCPPSPVCDLLDTPLFWIWQIEENAHPFPFCGTLFESQSEIKWKWNET